MDYIEGLFLGTLWSDTDYENRRHVLLFILYGLFVDLILLFSYFTNSYLLGLGKPGALPVVFYVILFLACPFLCFRYYRMPLWGKALVLIEKAIKAFLVIGITVRLVLPRITVESGGLQDFVINYLNGTLETYTEKFASDGGTFSTAMGVIVGGVHIVFVVVLILLAAIVIPGLVFLILRGLQYGYDWVIDKLVIRRFFKFKR